MRLLFSTLLTFILTVTITTAQVTPEKAFKNAKKEIGKYFLDQTANADKLLEAMNSIDAALEDETMQSNA